MTTDRVRRTARCLAPVLALVLTTALAGCDGVSVDRGPRGTLAQRAASASAAIGLALPAGARVTYAEQMHGMDDAARLILVMPDADWQRLREQVRRAVPDAPPLSAEDRAHLGSDEGAWAPGGEPDLIVQQVPWRQGVEALNLGVAPAGPGQVRVYVFWFQT